jgi:uncharacterized protein YuzE
VRLTYDREADALYITLTTVEKGGVKRTWVGEGENQGVHLDFDAKNRLVGIEVLDASGRVAADVLRKAEPVS